MRGRRLQCHRGERGKFGGREGRSRMGFRKKEGEGRATSVGEGTEEGKERVAQREGIESGHEVHSRGKERDQGKGREGCLG